MAFVNPADIDECESQPCLNGGECIDRVNNFTCTCPAAFTGTLCETGEQKSVFREEVLDITFLFGFPLRGIYPSGLSTKGEHF